MREAVVVTGEAAAVMGEAAAAMGEAATVMEEGGSGCVGLLAPPHALLDPPHVHGCLCSRQGHLRLSNCTAPTDCTAPTRNDTQWKATTGAQLQCVV